MPAPIEIRKADGSREPFAPDKLLRSLRRAGASEADAQRVLERVVEDLQPGTTTKRLYRTAFAELRRRTPDPIAARYGLARAIVELGPSGYPFERFVAAVLCAEGHDVRVGVQLDGRFVSHEIDVEATDANGRTQLCECKFRNSEDGKVDVRTALYVYARSDDLRVRDYDHFWLVTNGRFTRDAWNYGTGMGLRLVSWLDPAGEGLKDRIERAGVHPVTCLTHLRKKDKRALLRRDVVLCRELLAKPDELDRLDLKRGAGKRALREAAAVVGEGAVPCS